MSEIICYICSGEHFTGECEKVTKRERQKLIDLDYNLTVYDLILDSSSVGKDHNETLEWMSIEMSHDETARVIKHAAALYQQGVGTIGECLDTAIVWERG